MRATYTAGGWFFLGSPIKMSVEAKFGKHKLKSVDQWMSRLIHCPEDTFYVLGCYLRRVHTYRSHQVEKQHSARQNSLGT